MPFAALLFDLDGTLVDTAPDLVAALQATLSAAGLSCKHDYATMRGWVSHGGRYMLQQALNVDDNAAELDPLWQQFIQIYQDNISQHSCLFPHFGEILNTLAQQNCPWGIVTNKSESLTTPLLKDLQLDKQAGVVVCGDSLSEKKPHPAPLYYACQQLQVHPKDCLYIGDAKRDIVAGRHAGMQTAAALFGYLAADDDAHTWGADYCLHSGKDLFPLL